MRVPLQSPQTRSSARSLRGMFMARQATVVALLLGLSACSGQGPSQEEEALEYAIQACDITPVDGGGFTKPEQGDGADFIEFLTEIREDLPAAREDAVNAASAASLDDRWAVLAQATSGLLPFLEELDRWRDRYGITDAGLFDLWPDVNSDGQAYNDALSAERVQCDALLQRLSQTD